ncbi:MAG: DUF3042 family protein [Chloroflexi bacterium]|nr:DUF3042 family protein [Chloroflexota bacterium]
MSNKSFTKGFLLGLIGPLAFIAASVLWVHRFTGKVPFPVSKPADGELLWKLVPPEEVPSLYERWKKNLHGSLSKLQKAIVEIRDQLLGEPPAPQG